MTTEQAAVPNVSVPNIPLDPSKWADPKERFFGVLEICRYSNTDAAKDRDGNTFTEVRKWPRPGVTWEIVIKRLDAVYQLVYDNGRLEPVHRYMTIDLERFNDRTGRLEPIPNSENKATFVLEQWAKGGIKLGADPTAAQGTIAEWELLASKKFGRGVGKNMVYPVKLMPKAYEFTGDMLVIPVREPPRQDIDNSSEFADAASSSGSSANGAGGSAAAANLMSVEEYDEAFARFKENPVEADIIEFVQANRSRLSTAQKVELSGLV